MKTIFSPRLIALAEQLGESALSAVGLVSYAWRLTDERRQDSDLPGFTAVEFFGELHYEKDPRPVLNALLAGGWLIEHPNRFYSYAGWPDKHWFNPYTPGEGDVAHGV